MQWIALLLVTVFLPVNMLAQTTSPKGAFTNTGGEITWQALASRIPGGLDERRLRHLEQEWRVAEVEPNLLTMTHNLTGMVKYVDINNHQIDFSKLPQNVQVIDLINTDTTLYNWKYKRRNMFSIGSLGGYSMAIGDFNNNGKLDLGGSYRIPLIFHEIADCAIAELEDSNFVVKKIYTDSTPVSLASTDVDLDGLLEINFKRRAQHFVNYEQTHIDSFPDIFNFSHRMFEFDGKVASETFTDLDNDPYTDVLYVGTDSTEQCCHQIIIAEYDSSTNEMQRKFSMIPLPEWRVSGFSVRDFDNDGFMELVTGSLSGDIYVVENTGNDSYEQIFQDTLSTPNAFLTAATEDIDRNGKTELFVGGSAFYNGVPASRIYWFEADGNNSYQKLRSFFLLGTDVFGFAELYSYDVNGDGIDDLVFSFSFSVVMLIWNRDTNEFDLHYFDQWENYDQEIHSINMYDVFNHGKPDLFVNVKDIATTPLIRTYFYRPNIIAGIPNDKPIIDEFNLYQNYPNPFNGSTTVRFRLPARSRISITIYDITGKEVTRFIENQNYAPGEHEINWDGINRFGKEVSSGIYFYELRAEGYKQINKMLLIK